MSPGVHRLAWVLTVGILVILGVQACAPGGHVSTLRPHRAYDGAPPVIPHDVKELGRGNCLACHATGQAIWEGKQTPKTPHPEMQRCTQCHLEQLADDVFRPSSFQGAAYARGTRQQEAGPWLIPHPLTMREDCLDCHLGAGGSTHGASVGPDGHPSTEAVPVSADALPADFAGPPATTHPERARCTQCHLPAHEGWPGPRPGHLPGADR